MQTLRSLAVGTAVAVAAAGSAVSADIIEQILVKVNGEIITKTDLEARQVAAIRQRPEAQAMRGDDAAVAKLLTEVTPQVIVDAIDEMLLIQRGKELGYTMGDEQFNSIVENIRKENKIESEEQFQAALKQEGMTMLDLRRQLEKQMLVNRVQQTEVVGKIGVTDEEVKAYYEGHKDSLAVSPNVTLREILVAVPTSEAGVNVAADEEAAAKAEDIVKRLKAGEPFARLAADMSDAPSKANGGLLGEIPFNEIAPEVQKEISALQPGADHPGPAHAARLPDPAARRPLWRRRADDGGGPRPHLRARVRREAARRVPEVPGEAAQPGDHRMEERRGEEGLRRRPRRAGEGAGRPASALAGTPVLPT